MSVPSWVQDSIFYQIFPDRFMNGDPSNDPPVVLPWNLCATSNGFHGGDLRGISQRMDYLVDLGINAIYLNPIFLSPSNHRYNTVDYFRIDPKLGDLHDFHDLIETAHRAHVRVILDGVFNHCGRGFFAFSDILENQKYSPYLDWFHVKRFPLEAYSPGEAKNYEAWWGFKSLPKFNTSNLRVRRYLLDVARYWTEQGLDGWRMDVPNEIDDDSFWAEFRQTVLSINPQAYLCGEIWDALPRWVNDTHFDGLMDYPFRTAVVGLLAGGWTPLRFGQFIDRLLETYPLENNLAMYVLLGSHDTERVLTMMDGNEQKVKLATLVQFAFPGAPAVYYGDEIGLKGGKDPGCRLGFPWDTSFWNLDLRAWFKKLIHLRKESIALRRGGMLTLLADDDQNLFAFTRQAEEETVLVVINAGPERRSAHLPVEGLGWQDGRAVESLLAEQTYKVDQGQIVLSLEPWSGAWLH